MASDQNDGNAALAKAYVREMLELNPMWESATILRRRRELWTGDSQAKSSPKSRTTPSPVSASSLTPADEQADRRREERARRSLETLQAQFYQLPEDKLNQHLHFLQHDRLPEFAAVAKRLKVVAQHRGTLLKINKEVDDHKFTYSLLHGLVSPAAKAGSLREQYIESVIAERRVKPSCEMVRKIVAQYPQIYELERDWLNLFLDKQNQKQWVTQYSMRGRRGPVANKRELGLVGFALLVGLLIIGPLLAYPDKKRSNTIRSVPATPRFRVSDNPESRDFQKRLIEAFPPPGGIAPGELDQTDASSFQMPSGLSSPPITGVPSQPGLTVPTHEELMRQLRERPTPVLRPSLLEQMEEMKSRFPDPSTTPWDSMPRDPQMSPPGGLSPGLPRSRSPSFRSPGSRLPSFAPQSSTPRSFSPGTFP